jgi:hypothetical protein
MYFKCNPSSFGHFLKNHLMMAHLGRNMLWIDNNEQLFVTAAPSFLNYIKLVVSVKELLLIMSPVLGTL